MIAFDKVEIKKQISTDQIYELLTDWYGEPEYTDFGIISRTICHNRPDEQASRKLYYYENDGSGLFHCYTGGCEESSFDIFELTIKVFNIQRGIIFDLNDAVRYIARHFGILVEYSQDDENYNTVDWKRLNEYERFQNAEVKDYHIQLKEYDRTILNNLNYTVKLTPWLDEGITQEVIDKSLIGFFPGGDQITIPHFDIDNRFIGLRGRTLCSEDAEKYGKYRPLKVGFQQYNHPLGANLYNLNNSKDNIKLLKTAILFESEKSTLQYRSMFGIENDISAACCGSNLTAYQLQLLLDLGVEEVVIGFDRQFQELNTEESKRWIKKLTSIHDKYKNYIKVSLIFDKHMITKYKASPTDEGKDKFITLFKDRIYL